MKSKKPSLFAFAACLLSATMLAQSGTGALKVSSLPSGANVSVDGVDTGKVTPMSISLAVGTHTVVIQIPNSGWAADTRSVEIVSGNNDLSVTLLPIDQAESDAYRAALNTKDPGT